MRAKVLPVESPAGGVVLDTCGTGGDVRGTFNISTAAAILAASCGVKVVKHGNKSATSKSSSADVLEHLGIKLEITPEIAHQCLASAGICFAYARSHHPAMKFVAATRTSLGIPTIFNLLGPLTNPPARRINCSACSRPGSRIAWRPCCAAGQQACLGGSRRGRPGRAVDARADAGE